MKVSVTDQKKKKKPFHMKGAGPSGAELVEKAAEISLLSLNG